MKQLGNYSNFPPERVKQDSERRGKTFSRSESQQSHTSDISFFRSAFSAAAAEKRNGITKGSTGKISLNTPSSPLQRMLAS